MAGGYISRHRGGHKSYLPLSGLQLADLGKCCEGKDAVGMSNHTPFVKQNCAVLCCAVLCRYKELAGQHKEIMQHLQLKIAAITKTHDSH
jgi:hypothetical protein